jgi:iron(III) transport system substrate-binding protein
MRYIIITLLIFFITATSHALVIEDVRTYGPQKETADLRILSSTDIDVFDPVLTAYSGAFPTVSLEYVLSNTSDIYQEVRDGEKPFDLVMSSAMDLQMKLANDGFAKSVSLAETSQGPDWSQWQNKLFGFSLEPIGMVVSKSYFNNIKAPKSRRDLISFLRANQDDLRGKIVTYDVTQSGAGFLFATQDARQSDSYWRMAEVMGSLNTGLFCCSGEMLDAVNTGEILLAYNIIGSYAQKRSREQDNLLVIYPQDYTHMLLRTALVPRGTQNFEAARNFLTFLLNDIGQNFIEKRTDMLSLQSEVLNRNRQFKPIRLDTGLLVYLDRLKKQRFLEEWKEALFQ